MNVVLSKQERAAPAANTKPRAVVTLRSIVLGTLLIPLNCYWMAVMEIRWNSVDATCVSLFFHVIFVLFMLAIANRVLMRHLPRLAMSPAEMLIIYIMLSIASAIAGRDTMENLLPTLSHAFWFGNESNGYDRFMHYIPSWIAPQDPAVLKGYFMGNSSIYDPRMLRVWLPVVAVWSVFILAMLGVMMSVSVIVRRHWMDHEKLTFPTVFLPVEMATNKSFFSNRILWMGFALPFVVQTMNGLHHLFPSVPYIHLKLTDLSPGFASPPWNGMGWTPISFYPFAIGMAFLLPLDLSFSCWFFYIVKKLEAVAGVAMGYSNPGGNISWPYLREQGIGAWVGLCVFLVWAGRKHFGDILRSALGTRGAAPVDDSGELMSYRTACRIILISSIIMFIFCVKAGMPMWLPPIYLGFFFLLSIGITRIRAELGPPAHELNWVNPEMVMVSLLGTGAIGAPGLTAMTFMFWFNRGYRSHPMPHQLEAMKIGRDSRMEPRRLLAAISLACVVGVFAAFWALLTVFHQNGQATANIQSYTTGIGTEAYNRLADWTANPRSTDWTSISWMGLGFGFTVFLMVMKSKLFWWPFHPAGYALANSYALEYWWMTLLIGWLLKLVIVRYGGIKGYRQALPFFLGLILGDYIAASMWSIVGWAMGISVYRSFIF